MNLNWSYSPETLNSGQSRRCFVPVILKFDGWPWKNVVYYIKLYASFQSHRWIQSGVIVRKRSIRVFCPVQPWNLTADLENNRAPLPCCFKLCASFHSRHWIQTGDTLQKHLNWVKETKMIFLPRVNLTFDRWPWKARGHFFYVTSSFVHNF